MRPRSSTEQTGEGFQCRVFLPNNSPVRECLGPCQPSPRLARGAAFVTAVGLLHKVIHSPDTWHGGTILSNCPQLCLRDCAWAAPQGAHLTQGVEGLVASPQTHHNKTLYMLHGSQEVICQLSGLPRLARGAAFVTTFDLLHRVIQHQSSNISPTVNLVTYPEMPL